MPANLAHQRMQMGTRAHQHGDLAVRFFHLGVMDDLDDLVRFTQAQLIGGFRLHLLIFIRFRIRTAGYKRMHVDGRTDFRRFGGCKGPVADCTLQHTVLLRENTGKGLVDPLDHRYAGAVVAPEPELDQTEITYALLRHTQEQADVGLAKTIDGLHGVTDGEQRTAIARFPATRQALQQLDLGWAGVLEFIHQQMLNAVIELECQIGRVASLVLQRLQGALRDLDEIHIAVRLEHQPELRHGKLEQAAERGDELPGFVFVPCIRQQPDIGQRRLGSRLHSQIIQEGRQLILERLGFRRCRHAHVLVQALAQSALVVLAGQQQVTNRTPHG